MNNRPASTSIRGIAAALLPLLFQACSGGNGSLDVAGQIESVTVHAGSRVGGRVEEVLAQEGDPVSQGAPIMRLERREQEAAAAAARAALAQAQALLEKLENGARPEELAQAKAAADETEAAYQMAVEGARSEEINAARARADAAKAQAELARAEYERVRKLFDSGAISEQAFDTASRQREAAENTFKAANEQLDLLLHGTRSEQILMAKAARDRAAAAYELLVNGARREDIEAARAARDAAQAQLELAEVALSEMTVVAPRDGVIEALDIHPGDLVAPGPIAQVASPDDLELMIYVGAWVLGYLNVGDTVTLTTDSHGAETFQGRIVFIAQQGEYTPRNLQTEEERVQQVFGVKIALDSAGGKLRAGMTATAHLDAPARRP